jgi:hypothetical protein
MRGALRKLHTTTFSHHLSPERAALGIVRRNKRHCVFPLLFTILDKTYPIITSKTTQLPQQPTTILTVIPYHRLHLYKADISSYVGTKVRTPRTHLTRHHPCPFVTHYFIPCSLHPSSNRPLESTTTPLDEDPSTPPNPAASIHLPSLESHVSDTALPQPHEPNASDELNAHI